MEPITVKGDRATVPPASAIRRKNVLLLDSAIHSGRMMSHCSAQLLKHSPSSLTSYALTVKRCSTFFPTLWGVMTEEGDRPYFLLEKMPNNRLNAGAERKQQALHIRLLTEEHTSLKPIKSDLASIDRVTWSDRVFQMRHNPGTYTYLLQEGRATAGFLTVHIDEGELVIAEVVVDRAFRGRGLCGVLMRFAESIARQSDSTAIRLNAIRDKIDMYVEFGYAQSPGRPAFNLDDEEYHPMDRLVLYHQKRHHIDGSLISVPSDAPRSSVTRKKRQPGARVAASRRTRRAQSESRS